MAFQETPRHEFLVEDCDSDDIIEESQENTESERLNNFKNKKSIYSNLEDELSVEEDFMED